MGAILQNFQFFFGHIVGAEGILTNIASQEDLIPYRRTEIAAFFVAVEPVGTQGIADFGCPGQLPSVTGGKKRCSANRVRRHMVGVSESPVHFLLAVVVICKAGMGTVFSVSPGFVNDLFCPGRHYLCVGRKVFQKRMIGFRHAAEMAGLLEGDKIPVFHFKGIADGSGDLFPAGVIIQVVLCSGEDILPMSLQRAAADIKPAQNERAVTGFGNLRKTAGDVFGKAVANGKDFYRIHNRFLL